MQRDVGYNVGILVINALRGHAAEFGVVAAKGVSRIASLLVAIEAEETIPPTAKEMPTVLGEEISHLDTRLTEIETKLTAMHKANGSRCCAGGRRE
jgi:transposase